MRIFQTLFQVNTTVSFFYVYIECEILQSPMILHRFLLFSAIKLNDTTVVNSSTAKLELASKLNVTLTVVDPG